MGFGEKSWNVLSKGAFGEERTELVEVCFISSAATGEPVTGVAEEVVATFGVVGHVVGEDEVAEPEDHGDVEPIGSVFVAG